MRNTIKLFVLAAAMVFGGLSVANAQVAPQSQMKTNIPFSFVVDGKTFEAGDYTFTRLDTGGSNTSQLVMRGAHGATAIFDTIPTVAAEAPKKSSLVFRNVYGQHVLAQIWGAGDSEGSQVMTSRSDVKAIAAAKSGAATESTTGVGSNF